MSFTLKNSIVRNTANTLLVVLLLVAKLQAQNFPIQSSLQIKPPYSLSLADYTSPTNERMVANILLKDLDRPQLAVRFRLAIQGVGIRVETKPGYLPPPIYLQGGMPLRLTGVDLAAYFNPENLDFYGFNRAQYVARGALPEGLYQFTLEVLEYNRGNRASNIAQKSAWLILNDPPMLNLPMNVDKTRALEPQNLVFQWTPRHTGSPNAAFNTEYEFTLVEIWPANRNPNDAIFSTQPLYRTTTSSTRLLYGLAEPALVPGRRYAWRVQARAMTGIESMDLFKNNGFSEVYTFQWGDACLAPEQLEVKPLMGGRLGLRWQGNDNHSQYRVRYRPVTQPGSEWYSQERFQTDLVLANLRDSVTYELQVMGQCASLEGPYSTPVIVTTLPGQNVDMHCGLPLQQFLIGDHRLLEHLRIGDIIDAGDFRVKVLQANGSQGIYSGMGQVDFKLFNQANLFVSFTDIVVDTTYRMVNGHMQVYGADLYLVPEEILALNDQLSEALVKIDQGLADADAGIEEAQNIIEVLDEDKIFSDEELNEYKQMTPEEQQAKGLELLLAGDELIKNGQLAEGTLLLRKGKALLDMSGQGNVAKDLRPVNVPDEGPQLNWEAHPLQKYGFDAYTHQELSYHYQLLQNTGQSAPYYVSWKSVGSGDTDQVVVLMEKLPLEFEMEQLTFSAANGNKIPYQAEDTKLTLELTAGQPNEVKEIYPYYGDPQQTVALGKLNLVTYPRITHEVKLVLLEENLNLPTDEQIKQALDEIYAGANVQWQIESETFVPAPGWDEDNDNRIATGGTHFLSNYTKEMRKIVRQYRREKSTDKEVAYLFVGKGADPEVKGYMPRAGNYGFIFSDGLSNDQLFKTIAHELGHGVFHLQHIFEETSLAQGSTSNLMDMGAGTDLHKYQWDFIHDPAPVVWVFEDDEEGGFEVYEYLAGRNVVAGGFKEAIGLEASNGLSFVSRAGWVITIPPNAVDVTFNDSGTLMGFTITENGKQERYLGAQYTKGEDAGKFAGFLKDFENPDNYKNKVYKDEISKDLTGSSTNVYFGIIRNDNNNDSPCQIHVFKGEYPLSDVSGNYNTGGNKQPKVNIETIKGKLLSTYTDNKVSVPEYGDKIKYLTSVKSEHACNNCEKGKTFYEEYESTATDEESKYFLTKVSQLICDNESEIVDYEMLKKQINWDFQRLIENSIWNSDKISFKIARNTFWERPDAWKLYFEALEKTKDKIEYYNEQLNADISEDDFRVAVYYLNSEFLATLTLDDRVALLQIIFENNAFINENWFNSGKSDISLITKIVSTINGEELSTLLRKLIDKEQDFQNQQKDVLFEVINGVSDEALKEVSLDLKLQSLQSLLGGSLVNLFGATNYQVVIAKVVGSVKNENANEFFTELRSTSNYLVKEKPLLNALKNKLDDFLNSKKSYTEFFKQIKRLSDARYFQKQGSLEITNSIIWDVKNIDAVLISYVRNKNNFDFKYDEENNTVSITTCKNLTSINLDQAGEYDYCTDTEIILPEGTNPFDLIGITIINDISPFTGGCEDGEGKYGYCGEMFYIPAIFVEYLKQKVNTQRWENFGWNTFNVVITAATLGEGAAAITAIKTAQVGTRVAVAAKHSYTLLDFTYTVSNITLDAAGVEMGAAWDAVGYLFTAKTSYDLINKGGAKGLAKLKKTSASDKKRVIEKLGLNKNGKALTEAELDDYIKHVEAEIAKNPSSDLAKKYQIELKELENAGCISTLNKVDNTIDDVGNTALKEDDVLDELAKTNNGISDANKKFWANHETNVTKHLRETYGNANVGRQVRIDITLKNGNTITCRVDNLVKEGNSYKIIDAKSSISKQLHTKTAEDLAGSSWSTKNQKAFYEALQKGEVQTIKPRGPRADAYFLNKGGIPRNGIQIGNKIEFLVNDVAEAGYNIFSKILVF